MSDTGGLGERVAGGVDHPEPRADEAVDSLGTRATDGSGDGLGTRVAGVVDVPEPRADEAVDGLGTRATDGSGDGLGTRVAGVVDVPEPRADEGVDGLGSRVADWYAETARLRAETVTDLADGAWALRTPRWPDSFSSNAIVVRRDPGGERLVAWAEEQLEGLAHRYVSAFCDLTEETRAALTTAGYRLTPLVTMSLALWSFPGPGSSHPTSDIRSGAGVAERVGLAESGRLHRVLWTEEWMPGIGADEVDQLVGRRLDDSGGELLSWVVRDPEADHAVSGDLVACADLCLRGWTGEVDAVATREAFRGRGYGDSLMAAAVAEAAERGCSHVVLSALVDDWPRHWYARLGFVEVGTAWEALRRDDGLAFDGRGDATGDRS